jgi:hypothetical protein
MALWAVGLGDPVVWPVVGAGPSRRKLLEAAGDRCPDAEPGPTHAGGAWAERGGRWAAVLFFSRRWVDWGPARWKDGFSVAGTPLGPNQAGRLAWLRGCSSTLLCDRAGETPWRPEGSHLRVRLAAADVVEVLADTDRGPRVVGLWVRPGFTPRPRVPADPVEGWRRLRRLRGLPAGWSSEALHRAAQEHAGVVCRQGRAVHVDDEGQGPAERARRAGWRGPVAENVAVAKNPVRAFGNLLASPSHHRTLVDPEIRAFGFGLVEASDRSCLVQLFGYRRPAHR